MIFNSFDFALFIVPVFLLYWLVLSKSAVYQNVFLLISSVVFYAWVDWRFLSLLLGSIVINFFLGKAIHTAERETRQLLFLRLGLVFNVGLLLYFKYFNFFYDNFFELLHVFGVQKSHGILHIILPLGISFFTFQNLGYLIDVYNEEIEPSNDFLQFSVFVAFFPKILSGPIERAANFIPQIQKKRTFSYHFAVDGLRQFLWGLFAKVVIAENCAVIANPIFENYENESGSTILIGAFFYTIQLYADFSGYSNMALGISKLFGIELMRNFATPFFSTNISDFWRKWHISLTTWMMDYVFTPLSFTLRRYQKKGLLVSIIATFVLVGFWHGANWTFVVYGLLHGIYFIPLVYSGNINSSQIMAKGKWFPSVKEIIKMVLLFVLVMLTAIFFRADSVTTALNCLQKICSVTLIDFPHTVLTTITATTSILILFFIGIEWINREKKHDFEISNYHMLLRWGLYISLFLVLLFFGKSSETFIYFQF